MKTKSLVTIVSFFLIISCTSYKPFSSIKEKKERISQIKSSFNLTPKEIKLIKHQDSILYEIAESMDKEVKFYTTNRRIDSFLSGNYLKDEMLMALNIDQLKLKGEFDFDRTNQFKDRRLNIESLEELEKYMRKIDSSLMINMKIKVDTITKKKNKP
ncbi:hypothetical protein [uncultured Psychroserpens sp.]|uniref:hypothetical protein n=1 Tax=uncultured Psychroserpens sp. TaxID=255436 RepID=UPI002635FE45|nr:hypothetical protein [uncultured Psychroserpens sp.]